MPHAHLVEEKRAVDALPVRSRVTSAREIADHEQVVGASPSVVRWVVAKRTEPGRHDGVELTPAARGRDELAVEVSPTDVCDVAQQPEPEGDAGDDACCDVVDALI